MKEQIFNLINDFYGDDEFCEENRDDFEALAEYIAQHLEG